MDNKKIALGVFYGGRSCEHDVSIVTALQLMKAINKDKYEVIPVYISQKGIWYTGENLLEIKNYIEFSGDNLREITLDLTPGSGALLSLEKEKGLFKGVKQNIVNRIDCALMAFHGAHGEDGCIQGVMEIANIPYTSGGVAGCSFTMDKILMKSLLKGGGFPVVPGKWFYRSQWQENEINIIDSIMTFGLPVVIKPANLGSSIGVALANTKEEVITALEIAFSFDRKVLVEKAIENKIELNCSVLGYEKEIKASVLEKPKTVPLGEILDYNTKYLSGSKSGQIGMASLERQVPAQVSEEIRKKVQETSKEIFAAFDLKGVVRIDFMLEEETNNLYITEVNTIPGSMAFYLWEHSSISYEKLIDEMVKYAYIAFEQKKENSFAHESNILKNVDLSGGKMGSKTGKLSS